MGGLREEVREGGLWGGRGLGRRCGREGLGRR